MGKTLTRRAFAQASGFFAASLLGGCGVQDRDDASGQALEEPVEAEGNAQRADGDFDESTAPSKVLVVFYSRADENYGTSGFEVLEVGHTKVMAGYIAEALSADSYEIVPSEAYPFGYNDCCDQASDELAADARPALVGELPAVSAYDVVFIGCPIWWGNEPMVIRSFLDAVDLSGKTVVPFTTHQGSGLGSVPANLQARIPNARFLEAKAVAGTSVDESGDEIMRWAAGLDI